MRERIALVGGSLELHSMPGQGTEIRVRIPLRCTLVEPVELAHTATSVGETAHAGRRTVCAVVRLREGMSYDFSTPRR